MLGSVTIVHLQLLQEALRKVDGQAQHGGASLVLDLLLCAVRGRLFALQQVFVVRARSVYLGTHS